MSTRRPVGSGGTTRGVLLAASRDPDAKMTYLLTSPSLESGPGLVCKIPTTPSARSAVRREAQTLVELRRMPLGSLRDTIPRYVAASSISLVVAAGEDRATVPGSPETLVSTQLSGRPMSRGYHQWRHTSGRTRVTTDLDRALEWLASLWDATVTAPQPLTWAEEIAEELARRWDGSDLLGPALDRLRAADAEMAGQLSPRATVHGDFWFGNVLVDEGSVSGVVDWESAAIEGWPLRDVARFLLSYSLYIDRHTRPGRPVPGHPGLRRGDNGDALAYSLLGRGWYPDLVRGRLARSLRQLGLPVHLWYSVALTGLAEIAAGANQEAFGHDHLRVLATLPMHPTRPRRWGR